MTGIGMNFENPSQIISMLRDPSKIADELCKEHPKTGDSPAEIFADIVNTQRADAKKLAEVQGVEVEIKLMEPERAAELLAGTISGNGIELVVMFNDIAAKRDKLLCEILEPGEYETFMAQKHAIMNTYADVEE